MRIALGVEYDGSAFHGWQQQPCGNTVQDALQVALSRIAELPVAVVCAGRTDAGVHATAQVVHFDTWVERPLSAWVRGTNTFLPATVAVRWAHPVADDFHARFSAYARCYRYLLINRPQRTGVWHGRAGWYHHPLDVEVMQQAAATLLGEHDFSSFRAADCQARSPVRTIQKADVQRSGEMIVFDLEAASSCTTWFAIWSAVWFMSVRANILPSGSGSCSPRATAVWRHPPSRRPAFI